MFGLLKINIKEFNPLITCSICHGYLIDATSLSDCHHSFCRSCIAKHILTSNACPTCKLLIHKTKPESNLIDDKNLQQIVYKLVPGLLKDEIRRRDEFYSKENVSSRTENSLSASDFSDVIKVDDDVKICIVVDVDEAVNEGEGKILFTNKTKKYLFCPGLFTIKLLKKFFRDKCELDEGDKMEVVHCEDDEFVPDHYTLLDVANIYNWRADSPLELRCIFWNDIIFSTNLPTVDHQKLPEHLRDDFPFQSFKQFCKHLRNTDVCTIISQKKRHKRDRHKHAFRNLTNTTEAPRNVRRHKGIDDGSSGGNTLEGSSVDASARDGNQSGSKLKLRIRAKGIEDSILILPSTSDSTDSSVFDEKVERCRESSVRVKTLPRLASHVLEDRNEKLDKKFKSKKNMFFSRLGLDTSAMLTSSEDVSDSKIVRDKNISLLPDISSSSPLSHHLVCKPLTINTMIDAPNICTSTPKDDSYNFKKKLLLTTVPARTRGQLWTPYKSPSKDISRPDDNRTSSAERDGSKSPVIVFNPALPLPSFTSLLQSFDLRHGRGNSSALEYSSIDNSQDSGIHLNSKVGVFISKGRSITLEEKTKLKCDVSRDPASETGCFEDESSINKSLEELQELFDVKNHATFAEEHNLKNVEQASEVKEIQHTKGNCDGNSCNKFYKHESSKTSAGQNIPLKKSLSTGNESKDEGFVDEEMKSPQRKKPMLESGDGKNENDFSTEMSSKNNKITSSGLSSKICNISKRALKIIN